jgi:hypothetical protein
MPTVIAVVQHTFKGAFYAFGGLFAVWAVALGAVGLKRPEFPFGDRGARLVMLVSALLMVGAITSAIASG